MSKSKYYEVFEKGSGFMTIHITKSSALEERKYMQGLGLTNICIKLKLKLKQKTNKRRLLWQVKDKL